MRVLVAAIGNIFFGDDGFGPAVARALARDSIAGVKIEDYGIRGMHLAYELVSGYDRAIIVDAVARGETPGTLYVIEPDLTVDGATPDPHRMDLRNVFAFIHTIGGEAPPIALVGCEPEETQDSMELSAAVEAAVQPAADLVRRLIREALSNGARREERPVWTEV